MFSGPPFGRPWPPFWRPWPPFWRPWPPFGRPWPPWVAQVVSADQGGAHQLAGPGGGGWARHAEVRRPLREFGHLAVNLKYLHFPTIV